MLQHALKYLKMGWSVIPLRPSGKEPLIPWQEYQKRLPTEQEVLEWWSQWPTANIGLVTGSISNLLVLDADGEKGLKYLQEVDFKSPVTVISGKGKHLYFKWSEGIRNSASKIAEGVDIRGEGGYCVLPPSSHPNGLRYRWERNLIVPQLPSLPEGLVKAVGPSIAPGFTPAVGKPVGWISEALKGMKHGNIDDTLFTVCSRLRADGYSRDDARILLQPHAERAGATPGHLDDKIDNVWARYTPNRKDPEPVNVPVPDEVQNEAEGIEAFLQTDEKVDWIVSGLIANKSIGFIVGLPETGKTWACIDLAIEAATGGKWLGQFGLGISKVLFIDQERFKGETKRRFKAVLAAKGLSPKAVGNLSIKCGTSIKIDLEHSYNAFRKELERLKPELVIVDSLATFHTKEENSRKDIQEVLERIKGLRNEFGCTFLFIHHENKLSFQSKEEGKEPSLAEMSGNIAIPAAAEVVLTMRKRIDGTSIVYNTKNTLHKAHAPFEITVKDIDGPEKIEVKGYL